MDRFLKWIMSDGILDNVAVTIVVGGPLSIYLTFLTARLIQFLDLQRQGKGAIMRASNAARRDALRAAVIHDVIAMMDQTVEEMSEIADELEERYHVDAARKIRTEAVNIHMAMNGRFTKSVEKHYPVVGIPLSGTTGVLDAGIGVLSAIAEQREQYLRAVRDLQPNWFAVLGVRWIPWMWAPFWNELVTIWEYGIKNSPSR